MSMMIKSQKVNGFKVGGNDVSGVAQKGKTIWKKPISQKSKQT